MFVKFISLPFFFFCTQYEPSRKARKTFLLIFAISQNLFIGGKFQHNLLATLKFFSDYIPGS